jgi:hypothetical protein
MSPTIAACTLGTCLLAATIAAGATGPSWFEARTTGARTLTLRGSAEFGSVPSLGEQSPFVITLGAHSAMGAVVLTRRDGARPEPGVYRLAEESVDGIQALVVTGPPDRPTGVYRARSGLLTVTSSDSSAVTGRFEIDAMGYDVADPLEEDRPLRVHGLFTAAPGSAAARDN